jgi:hypothetical protein
MFFGESVTHCNCLALQFFELTELEYRGDPVVVETAFGQRAPSLIGWVLCALRKAMLLVGNSTWLILPRTSLTSKS